MATITQHAPGTFCWFELHTSDEAGAKAFYSGLFGWTVESNAMGEGGMYHMLKQKGLDVGAACGLGPEETSNGVPPYWMSYVSVESAAKAAERAKELGGTVLFGPFDVMEHGRMAVIQDPTGAVFSVWEPLAHIGVGILDEPGSQAWNELMTRDTDKAGAFYSQLFPWTMKAQPMPGPDGNTFTYTLFQRGETNAAGMMAMPPQVPAQVPPHWMTYFAVENTSAAVAKATALGGKVVHPESPSPYGTWAILADPQGAVFSVVSTHSS
jgi:predicted enzyme related to lactoylglutathione lyase